MMTNRPVHKTLSALSLLREVCSSFQRIEDNTTNRGLTLTDCLG